MFILSCDFVIFFLSQFCPPSRMRTKVVCHAISQSYKRAHLSSKSVFPHFFSSLACTTRVRSPGAHKFSFRVIYLHVWYMLHFFERFYDVRRPKQILKFRTVRLVVELRGRSIFHRCPPRLTIEAAGHHQPHCSI